MPAGCTYLKSTHGTAIVCEGAGGEGGVSNATACAAGEVQICSADLDCPSGMHCMPGKWKIYQLGFCQYIGHTQGAPRARVHLEVRAGPCPFVRY
jgi:hypothetical protein